MAAYTSSQHGPASYLSVFIVLVGKRLSVLVSLALSSLIYALFPTFPLHLRGFRNWRPREKAFEVALLRTYVLRFGEKQ